MQANNFLISLMLIVVILALAGIAFMQWQRQQRHRIVGVQLMQAGRVLLVYLQQHRGSVVAYLAGIHEPLGDITELRRKVLANMKVLANIDDWFANNENWEGVTSHWARLSAKCDAMPVDGIFDQHCRLNLNLLALLMDVAEHYRLQRYASYSGAAQFWRELLTAGELVGQCRALGMELIAADPLLERGHYQRRKMLSNIELLNELINRKASDYRINQKPFNALRDFVNFLHEQMFIDFQSISAKRYFDHASEVIELVYEQYDSEIHTLSTGVRDRRS